MGATRRRHHRTVNDPDSGALRPQVHQFRPHCRKVDGYVPHARIGATPSGPGRAAAGRRPSSHTYWYRLVDSDNVPDWLATRAVEHRLQEASVDMATAVGG